MNKAKAQKIIKLSRNSYEAIAEEFSRSRRDIWPELRHIKNYFIDAESVLDVGCGNGRFIDLWDFNKVRYTGIDNSEKLIEKAKAIYGGHGYFIVGDALKLPFENNFFDGVLSIAVLHHIPSFNMQLKFFTEIHRVLKSDGITVVTAWKVNREKYKKQLALSAVLKFIGVRDHGDIFMPFGKTKQKRFVHAFTKTELMRLATTAGFKIIEYEQIPRPSDECNIVMVLKKI